MNDITITTRSVSTNKDTNVSNTVTTAHPLTENYPPMTWIIEQGPLPYGRWLTNPIVVLIEDDDGEFVVSELKFYMHASGSTIAEAIEAFKRIFSGYLDVLSSEEDTLGVYLRKQLEYLQSIIRTV